MNIPQLISDHEKAIEMLEEIQRLGKMRHSLLESANGFGGENFPDKKKEWLDGAKRYQERIDQAKVDYRTFLNSTK